MFKRQPFHVITTIISFFVTVTLFTACSKPEKVKDEEDLYHQSANIQVVSPSDFYEVPREYIGKVVSKQVASLSFEYGGKVDKVYIDSGDVVAKGQLLAELNTDLLAIKLQEINASISQLNAKAELNRSKLKRMNELSAKGYSAQQTLDVLESEQKIISAELARQQANKSAINYQISKAKLHAPFAAVVGERFVAEGEVFTPRQPAFELLKQHQHEISVGVPVKVARAVNTGQILPVTFGKQQVSAKVLVVGKQVNPISRTVELRLAVTDNASFYNGQLAKIKIKQRVEEAGFWLPLAALTDGVRGQWNIYEVDETQKSLFTVKATTVEVKHSTLDKVYITGLPLKEHLVIVEGVHRYVPGQIVKKSTVSHNKNSSVGNAL